MRSVAICVLPVSRLNPHTAFLRMGSAPRLSSGVDARGLSPVLKQVCWVVRVASSGTVHPPLFCSFTARPSSPSVNYEILDTCILTLRVLSAGSAQGCLLFSLLSRKHAGPVLPAWGTGPSRVSGGGEPTDRPASLLQSPPSTRPWETESRCFLERCAQIFVCSSFTSSHTHVLKGHVVGVVLGGSVMDWGLE